MQMQSARALRNQKACCILQAWAHLSALDQRSGLVWLNARAGLDAAT